jgi:hypothetical protein
MGKIRPRSRSKRAPSELAGPLRKVVYIFERDGERGGGIWWLVLECGHSVARKRYVGGPGASPMIHLLFRPLEEKLAPKRCQCFYCAAGHDKIDPWITINAFGGPTS